MKRHARRYSVLRMQVEPGGPMGIDFTTEFFGFPLETTAGGAGTKVSLKTQGKRKRVEYNEDRKTASTREVVQLTESVLADFAATRCTFISPFFNTHRGSLKHAIFTSTCAYVYRKLNKMFFPPTTVVHKEGLALHNLYCTLKFSIVKSLSLG